MKLSDIKLNGICVYIDGEFENLAQCSIDYIENILSFCTDYKYVESILRNSKITSIICTESLISFFLNRGIGIIISNNPKLTFFLIHNHLNLKKDRFNSIIDKNAVISEKASISKENVVIGSNVLIEEFVVIKENVYIGSNSIIRSGCVIGSDGFEYKRNSEIDILSVNHNGKVILGESVEVKEYVTIHQAVFDWDYTKIDDFSKLDSHTHVGHATKIGKRVLIGSHANLAGNIILCDDVYIGPGASISNRLVIGKMSKVSIGSVVTKDVLPNLIVTGNFAIPHDRFIANLKINLKDTNDKK